MNNLEHENCKLKEYIKDLEQQLKESRYFGSDLNKFIHHNCKSGGSGLVVNNIDLIMHEYKKDRFRIIESKHLKENLGYAQKQILEKLNNYIESFVVRGNEPYDSLIIQNCKGELITKMDKKEFIKWINFENELKYK